MNGEKIPIGTIGLGLMGSSIATCLLAAGHKVITLVRDVEKGKMAKRKILNFLEQLKTEKLLNEDPSDVVERMIVTDNINQLSGLELVIESIHESITDKRELFRQLESVLSEKGIIGTNTSCYIETTKSMI